jgi:hypothetical protein
MQHDQDGCMRFLFPALALTFLATVNFVMADAPSASTVYTGKPETGTALVVPGTIPAIGYDEAPGGGAGITFSYGGKARQTKFRKAADSIGIAEFGKGHVSRAGAAEDPAQVYVGWTQSGEWLKYTLEVKEAGTYVIGAKVSAGAKGGTLRFAFSSGADTGEVEIPTTAGFQPGVEVYHVWETLDHVAEVTLPAGPCVMTVSIGKIAGMNLETFTLRKKS